MTDRQEHLLINNQRHQVYDLTEFGFVSPIELEGGQRQGEAILVIGDQQIPINFRVRQKKSHGILCSFSNFSIANKETLKKYLTDRERASGNEELESRSYDELARGIVSSGGPSETSTPTAAPTAQAPQQRASVKTFALLAMLFAMIALGVLGALFMRSRSSLTVSNSALVGNFLPVNARVEGEIVEVLVNEGDYVEQGDVLIRLINPEMESANQELAAQLGTAKATVKAIKSQLKTFDEKLDIAKRKSKLDLKVAQSELKAAEKARDSSESAFERLKPYVESGAITQLELDEAENGLRAHEANCIAKENQILKVRFTQEAIESRILILGDRLDDERGRLNTELEIAEARCKELELIRALGMARQSELEIIAPRDGQVYTTYRQVGEYVKIADQLLAISFTGKTWAAGQVTSTQASRVLPGQPVRVKIPSMGMSLDGVVAAVGHRAMYSNGHYTADFRGSTATDVPVKVAIADLPDEIPSGLRLEMAIKTGFGIEWLDDQLGYELKPIGTPRKTMSPELAEKSDVIQKVSLSKTTN